MLFSSITFLGFFLPIVLILYYALPSVKYRNCVLLLSSLLFYAWGEPKFVLLMIISIIFNFNMGIFISEKESKKKILIFSIIVNLGVLFIFKYLNFAVDSSWCYNKKNSNCDTYGRLYQCTAAMDINVRYLNDSAGRIIDYPHQGVCPKGWHIPADEEWKMLADFARDSSSFKSKKGLASDYGLALVSKEGWFDSLGVYGGTDEFHFNILPAGKRWRQGAERAFDFYLLGTNAYFWSTYEYSPKGAYHWDMYVGSEYSSVSGVFSHNGNFKESAYSVRCLKNNL